MADSHVHLRGALFSLLIVLLGVVYLVRYFSGKSFFNALDLNTVNLILFLLTLLLHWRPWRMARAVRDGAPAAAGVLVQFPCTAASSG
ncbi:MULTISPECIES: TIGR00366 family protein [unclassified Kribbella]|uniref:TIGR00366 family protein n=1 Tax=unclassified Kribbella TaxID=2644121 RepID=UPI0033EA61B7